MVECVMCGGQVEEGIDEGPIEETEDALDVCRDCRSFLRMQRGRGQYQKRIKYSPIRKSAYPLPGFVLSKNKSHYVRKGR